jgi:membrane-bound serine protease (ClpP class)
LVDEMPAFGLALLVIGILLVVAETHVPGGTLGALGGLALIVGGIVAIMSVGGPIALAVPVGAILGVGAGGWTLMTTREAARGPRRRIRAGAEAMSGRVGVVRRWSDTTGQVFLDGALWRARHEHLGGYDLTNAELHEGDRVVVEYVNGLTLCVRAAEDWELSA